jgi:hypothetical protein
MVAMADTVSDTGVQSILNEPRTSSPKSKADATTLVEEAEAEVAEDHRSCDGRRAV